MEQEQKHYYAFISHSTTDEKIALWLRKELEGYHIPSAVQRDYHAPKRLRPVFMYQTDLAGTQLEDALGQSLADSQYLIVVCSPSAAQSGYVNNEVQHFIDTGRADKIIPFIVSGTPYASQKGNSSDECFPPALISLKEKGQESRGINLSEMTEKNGSKMSAVVNVIASMLGVRYDVLWDRYQRRQRKIITISTIIICILFLIGMIYSIRMLPSYKYYSTCALRNGILEGIEELHENDKRHSNGMYSFCYKRRSVFSKNKVLCKISFVNSYNIPVAKPNKINPQNYYQVGLLDDATIIYPYYDEDDELKSILLCDEKDNKIASYSYNFTHLGTVHSYNADITYFDDESSFFESLTGALTPKSNILRIRYYTDKDGYVTKMTYHSHNGAINKSIMQDASGVCGLLLDYDERHRVITYSSIDENGHVCCNKQGLGILKKAYIGDSILLYSYFNEKNEKCLNSNGFFQMELKINKYGNVISVLCLDTMGNSTNNYLGWSKVINNFNNVGLITNSTYYDASGDTTYYIDGYSTIKYEYDKMGNPIEVSHFDINGNYIAPKSIGCPIVKRIFDKRHNIIETRYLDANRNLTLSKENQVAIITRKFDKQNRCIEMNCYDTALRKVLCKDGYHRVKLMYNKGFLKEIHFYDENNNSIVNKNDGCALTKCEMYFDDDNHKILTRTFYDSDHKSIFNPTTQCYKTYIKLNENANIMEIKRLNSCGELMLGNDGWAAIACKYDELGRMILKEYYDEYGELRAAKQYGKSIDSIFFVSNSHYFEYSLNEERMVADNFAGYAIMEYEKRQDTIIKKFYNKDHELTNNINHYSISKEVFRGDGQKISSSSYNEKNEPCLNGNCHEQINTFDAYGNIVQSIIYDTNHNKVFIEKKEYDYRHNCISEAYFDSLDNPISFENDKIHMIKLKYDAKDQMIECASYGKDSFLLRSNLYPYAIIRYKYDEKGNRIEISCYDEKMRPTKNQNGVFMEKSLYDKHNLLIETMCLDSLNRRINNNEMYCIKRNTYNSQYQLCEERILGADMLSIAHRKILYTSNGYPKMAKYIGGVSSGQIATYTPFIITENKEQYVILQWENWNITQGINAQLSYLINSRNMLDKKMIVMDINMNTCDTIFNNMSKVDISVIPQNIYKKCSQEIMDYIK